MVAMEGGRVAVPTCVNSWWRDLVMMAIFLIAAHLSRVREQKLLSVSAVRFS
jgi:hypothetical protein